MDTEYIIYFLLFILANSYFMYRAGQREGKFHGMIQITRFFKEENALIDLFTITKLFSDANFFILLKSKVLLEIFFAT